MQALILKLTFLGIGGASAISGGVLDYQITHSGEVVPIMSTLNIDPMAEDILMALVVQEYQIQVEEKYLPTGLIYTEKRINPGVLSRIALGAKTVANNVYGFVSSMPDEKKSELYSNRTAFYLYTIPYAQTNPNPDTAKPILTIELTCFVDGNALCEARKQALGKLMNAMDIVAQNVISIRPGGESHVPSYDRILYGINQYKTTVRQGLKDYIANSRPEYKKRLKEFVGTSKELGWTMLGAYYWTIHGYQKEIETMLGKEPSVDKSIDFNEMATTIGDGYAPFIERLDTLIKIGRTNDLKRIARRNSKEGAGNGLFESMMPDFIDVKKQLQHGDPVVVLQNAGHWVITSAYAMAAIAAILEDRKANKEKKKEKTMVEKGASFIGGLISSIPFIGGIGSAVTSIINGAVNGLALMLKFALIPLFILGISLAFYLPSLPFILWTSAVIGWILITFEALVASTLWIAVHAIPEGEGMAGDRGKKGYMLLLGVLARPWLMIMGFSIALMVMPLIGPYIAIGYDVASSAMDAMFLKGPLTYFVELAILGALMITLVHKTFGLVTYLDDNVLKWTGEAGTNLGEEQDENKTKGAVGAFYQRVDSNLSNTSRAIDESNRPPVNPVDGGKDNKDGRD